MNRHLRRLALASSLVVAGTLLTVAPAAATPSCVAQSVLTEHEVYGTAWGHDVIAFLAGHPEVLQEFGFRSFGDLASFAAAQDRDACPADL